MSRTILIVDDNQAVRAIIRSLFATDPDFCVCGEASDGLEAIEKARDLKPDLVVLDMSMPKLNGAAAALVIRKELPKVCIVMLTMYEDSVRKLAPSVGVDMVLSKSDGVNYLVRRVQELLQSRPQLEAKRASAN